MFSAALILTATVILSPDPKAIAPVARPLCLINVGASTIVYAGDVKEVKLSDDKSTVWILSAGGKLSSVAVPADQGAEAFRTSVANNISVEWTRCKSSR